MEKHYIARESDRKYDALYHYGILGMKWRFRRKKKGRESEGNAISKVASKVSQQKSNTVTLKEVAKKNAKETREKRVSEQSTSNARREKIKTTNANIASKRLNKKNSLSTSGMISEKTKQKAKERVARIIKKGLSTSSARKENPKVKNFIKKTQVRFMRFRSNGNG